MPTRQKRLKNGTTVSSRKRMKNLQPILQEDRARGSKENALQNSVVLNIMFGFLNEKDLRSCRLVQTAWNPEANSILKRKGKHIDLHGGSFNISTLFRFIDCVQSSQDFPFTKIHLRSDFHPFSVSSWNVLVRFIAPWVTSLEISGPSTFLPLPTGIHFPRLCEFNIGNADHSFVVQLVSNAPMLTSFEIFYPEKETLLALCQMNSLRLTKIRLMGYECDKATLKAIKDFLKSQKETLTNLTVFSYTYTKKDAFQAVPLKNLKTLNLGSFYSYGKPVEAGMPFPALTKFKMCTDNGHLTNKDFMNLSNGQPLTSVRKVELSSYLSHRSLKVHVVVPRLFPNISCLKIPTSVDNLLLVFENLANLRDLQLLYHNQNCSLARLYSQLTGIPEIQGKGAKKISAREILKMRKDFAAKLKTTPYSALEKIQRLKLGFRNSELNDCELICRVIITQLKNLKYLHIDFWHEKNTYKECFSMLSKGMKEIVTDLKKKFVVILT